MGFLKWFLQNFGLFFGMVFLFYLYMMIRRLIILYDFLRHVSPGEETPVAVGNDPALFFLTPFFERLKEMSVSGTSTGAASDAMTDAIWSEVDCRINVHFTAMTGYVNTIILVGFAGTIFGAIGAFNEMFAGIATGLAATEVFVSSWNHGLSTALYTSLGAAAIGGVMVTLLGSKYLLTRARRLETMVGLRISEILSGDTGELPTWPDVEDQETALTV
jgi:hypothetical protein